MDNEFCNKLKAIVGQEAYRENEPMKLHTTFKVGGPADVFITPTDESSFIEAINYCREKDIPYMIIGNGSNLLVGDKGIRGVVFQIYHTFDHIVFEPAKDGYIRVRAGAGVMLAKLSRKIAAKQLDGFEFASGIPGTFGGALTMNAGAYGGEISQFVVSVKVADSQGHISILTKDLMDMGYRSSIIDKEHYIVLEGILEFKPGDAAQIQEKIQSFSQSRREKQPLEYASAGSTFKRPEGYFAGKLIEDAGLKGYSVGDARVSEKHSGFVINTGHATAADILQLIHDVQTIVQNKFNVTLETEVRIVGEF